MPKWSGVFRFGTFLSVALSNFKCITLRAFFETLLYLFYVTYILRLPVMFFSFTYFCTRLSVYPHTFSSLLLTEFFLDILELLLVVFKFFTPARADGLPLESEWQKSPQVSRTFLSILTNLNNAAGGMVSARPLISKSSSPFSKPLEIVPNISIAIGLAAIFHSFISLKNFKHLSLFSLSLIYTL